MQKKIWAILFIMMLPMWLFGQSYSELWKKAKEAEDKDLPKTQYEVLQKIVAKAEKEKAYGQLLKAELNAAQVMSVIAAVRPPRTRSCVWCIRRCSIG